MPATSPNPRPRVKALPSVTMAALYRGHDPDTTGPQIDPEQRGISKGGPLGLTEAERRRLERELDRLGSVEVQF